MSKITKKATHSSGLSKSGKRHFVAPIRAERDRLGMNDYLNVERQGTGRVRIWDDVVVAVCDATALLAAFRKISWDGDCEEETEIPSSLGPVWQAIQQTAIHARRQEGWIAEMVRQAEGD